MKATEQYFPVVLCIMLYNVLLTFTSQDEILKCDRIQMKPTGQYFPLVLFIMLYKVISLTFTLCVCGSRILKCDHSNESDWAVLSCGAVYHAAQGGSNFYIYGWNLLHSGLFRLSYGV